MLRLARLAVDERAQGRGVGRVFLKAVFGLAKDLSQDYGCVGVVVDATPEAITFDQRYGFIEFFGWGGHLVVSKNTNEPKSVIPEGVFVARKNDRSAPGSREAIRQPDLRSRVIG